MHDLEDGAGFDPEGLEYYLSSEDERESWGSAEAFLGALSSDVWWHYGHVGDPEDKPDFEKTEDRIDRAVKEIKRCRR